MSPSATCGFSRSEICGVPVDRIHLDQFLTALTELTRPGGEPEYVCYLNVHVHNLARRDALLRSVLQRACIVYPDGAGISWAARWLGHPVGPRMTAADFLPQVVQIMHALERRVYLLGGRPGVAEACAQALSRDVPGWYPAGIHHGFFTNEQRDRLVEKIVAAKPDLLVVGLGTPRQEVWVAEHLKQFGVPCVWCVGALFDYWAGVERRCPAWMGQQGLEWLYRLACQPKKMASRYLLGNPAFVFAVAQQRMHEAWRTWCKRFQHG